MLKSLGQAIWHQSRDIRVSNYAKAILYEIPTNHGTIRLVQDKDTNQMQSIFKSWQEIRQDGNLQGEIQSEIRVSERRQPFSD